MGEVIELRPKAAAKGDTKSVLSDMMAMDSTGEMQGSICIAATTKGTQIHLLGSCADRLQTGAYGLVKALNFVCEKIIASGTAGNTPGGTKVVTFGIPNPKRTLPKRLREASTFGDL